MKTNHFMEIFALTFVDRQFSQQTFCNLFYEKFVLTFVDHFLEFQYVLKYANSDSSTQQWIGSHRYLVVDLASSPQSYGGNFLAGKISYIGREADQGVITGYSLGNSPSAVVTFLFS
jgi:hypothetical protein